MGAILTVEQVKAYARNEIATEDDDFIASAVDAAEAMLRDSTMRTWATAGAASARSYVPGRGVNVLRIHDCTTVTLVVENGVTVPAAAYQLEPVNGLSISGETVPYTQIRLINGHAWYTDADSATVTVTATWGWPAIPARIEQAALIIAKEILVNRDEVKLGLVGFSDVGGVTARTNPIVRDTINHYRRAESWGLA